MNSPSGDLKDALAAETAARDTLIRAINAEEEARKARKLAEAAMATATRRRQLAFSRTASANRMSVRDVREAVYAPILSPEAEHAARVSKVRTAAVLALRQAGKALLALELGPAVGIPPRAVRNYLDGDDRFTIDHVRHNRRDAVRVSLTG